MTEPKYYEISYPTFTSAPRGNGNSFDFETSWPLLVNNITRLGVNSSIAWTIAVGLFRDNFWKFPKLRVVYRNDGKSFYPSFKRGKFILTRTKTVNTCIVRFDTNLAVTRITQNKESLGDIYIFWLQNKSQKWNEIPLNNPKLTEWFLCQTVLQSLK